MAAIRRTDDNRPVTRSEPEPASTRPTAPSGTPAPSPRARRTPAAGVPGPTQRGSSRRLHELAALQELTRLATLARDWDELMRTIIERTTDVFGVEVCSFYLMDGSGTRLTLAATNGLDRAHVGQVSLAVGEGITGTVAATREPIQVRDVSADPRFRWVRGYDLAGLTSMLSVPLAWHERVVGVINLQTVERRRFRRDEVEFLQAIAAVLAGVVEKGRLQAEIEARLVEVTALDAGRAELLSVVTHELRTPLAIIRAYLDLLADAASGHGDTIPRGSAGAWRDAATEQVTRMDRLVDSILAAVRGEGLSGLAREPFDVGTAVSETVESLRLILRPHVLRWEAPATPFRARGDDARFRQVLEQLLENEAKYVPADIGVSVGIWREGREIRVYVTDDGPGVPIAEWEAVFQPYVRIEATRARGSGIGLFAARRLMDAMGGRAWIEPNGYGGSRFVVALPAEV